MAVPRTTGTLSPAEIAEIPSARLPIGPQLAQLVQEFTALSVQLFTVISSPTTPTPAVTEPIYAALAVVDSKLSKLVHLAALHRERQKRIDHLVASLETVSASAHAATTTLAQCVAELEPVVASGTLDRAAISRAAASSSSSSSVSTAALLSYARLLAPFTSAPPSSLYPPGERLRTKGLGATDPTGRTLPPGAIPPFPTEGVMRRGRLQFGRDVSLGGGGGGDGLGQTGEIGARREGQEQHRAEVSSGINGGGDANAIERLQFEAKQYESQHQHQHSNSHNFTSSTAANGPRDGRPDPGRDEADDGPEGDEEEEFEFDLDLNPDL
ncbi:hypothetical protein JCM11491_005035 [Sporobolomyces phaffii]